AVTTILRAMEIAGGDAEFVREEARRWVTGRSRVRFERLHASVQRQCVSLQLLPLQISREYEMVEELRLFPNKPVSVDGGRVVHRDAEGWIICRDLVKTEFNPNESFLFF